MLDRSMDHKDYSEEIESNDENLSLISDFEKPFIPLYKIKVPVIKETCDQDECITNQSYNSIKSFLENNYTTNRTNDSLIVNQSDDYIEFVENAESDDTSYTYQINRYTTINDVKEVIEGKKVASFNGNAASQVPVLNYHFFYDATNESCNEMICLDVKNFEAQLKYLKENNFKTLTIEEFRAWMYGEIEVPQKSVLLTIDDGAMGTSFINGNKLIPLLEKYQTHATLFLITGWWDKANYQSDYLDLQSHGNLIHEYATCNGSRKAKLLCLTSDQLRKDFASSMATLESNTSFCFPYYISNNTSINVLKELDFKLAFVGGNRKAKRSDNKYQIPRYIIYKSTSLNSFKNMVN